MQNALQIFLLSVVLLVSGVQTHAEAGVHLSKPGDDLQAVLDSGEDLWLEPGQVYLLEAPLTYTTSGQKIATYHPASIRDYAVLRIANRDMGQLINGARLDDILLEQVTLDGNRYSLSSLPKSQGMPALVFFGGDGAERQTVRRCVFMNPRTWSTLKVHEGGSDIRVEDNIFLNAGHDVRGNGRDLMENPRLEDDKFWYNWGDGISCASVRTTVRNNLILDPTDVGIVFFAAPGSVAEENVIASISRESLGGINLVDPLSYYALEEDPQRIDYRGTTLRNNWIDARGGRIHMAIPIGATPWVPAKKGFTFVGGSVLDNRISGGAAAYGIVISGVEGWTVTGNRTTASYSGIAEGEHRNPPDDPGPFLYEAEAVQGCELQEEFVPANRHLRHLLRCNHLPRNSRGYRDYGYGDAEAEAVVRTAYEEMLGRSPDAGERMVHTQWLQKSKATADSLRRGLMVTPEFIRLHGAIHPDRLHSFRTARWLEALGAAMDGMQEDPSDWPAARDLYTAGWEQMLQ
jgi:hypothetical protein